MKDLFDDEFKKAWNRRPEITDDDMEWVAEQAWNRAKGPLERLYDHLNPDWEEGPQATTYIIYDYEHKPIPCCICDEVDRWVPEDPGHLTVFVCDHGAVEGLPFRQLDSKVVPRDVARWEVSEEGDLADD